ncbi:drug resistance transporter, EmrB/QacA subfamily [Ruegeria halocynthiae]|uniref:Drug resistance transporter, EmrB/QacA subfamily n=1 Tax=Ruegeria halocynthiae TaxID=985054 RepID=A0A1H3CPP6_9RHOB|nr:MFS transporter [Ruegeria halocynthiae]SDX56212.1 drug resistance transporter, EmrB/QacA subfamily [Ruegeria halocynthiae]
MKTSQTDGNSGAGGARMVLIMTAICMMVVGFNTTAVATILPNLKAEFDLTPSGLQWVMAAYTVASATLVTIVSRLGDITGKMGVFFFGMIVFAVGSILALLSQDATMMLIGRGAQGAGAAALFGTSLSILTAATPEDQRASVTGAWGAIVGLAIGVGPIVGGAFAHYISWRAVFATDLVLLAIAFIIGLQVSKRNYVPDMRQADARFDYAGAIAMIMFLGPLSFALGNGEGKGWGSMFTLVPLAVSGCAVVALVLTSRLSQDPLIELRYFRHPRYFMAAAGMFFTGFTLFAFFVYFNVFVQSPDAFGYSAIDAGSAILPLSVSMFIVSVTAPRFLAPYSFRWPVALGMGFMACGFLLLMTTTNTTSYAGMWWKLVIVGIGLGIGFSLLPRLGLRLLPEEHVGQGSGVINAFLYFGATLGAVIGGLAESITIRRGLSEVINALPAGSSQRTDLAHALTHGTPSQVQQLIAGLNPDTGAQLAKALRDLQDNAFDSAMLVAAIAAFVAMMLALMLLKGPVPPVHSAVDLTKD